jgi:rhamnogalacturonan endolyase
MDALQYWAEIDPATGLVEIPRVKEDVYRLTAYADGVFGMFVEDDVVVSRRNHKGQGQLLTFRWEAESAGKGTSRIRTPDKSAAELRHGRAPYTNNTLGPEEYRMFWVDFDS